MEASKFCALPLKPRLNRPSLFSHARDVAILDSREHGHLPGSCIDNGRMFRYQLNMCPRMQCNLALGGNTGEEAKFPVSHDLTSRAVPSRQASRSRSLKSCQVTREESGGSLSGESILINEQTLERELQIAIKEENYAQAAKIRDSLRLLQEDSKASVLAANARFYNSFRNGDLAAMQALWSKGDHVCVVHPGVSGISGHDLVMGAGNLCGQTTSFLLKLRSGMFRFMLEAIWGMLPSSKWSRRRAVAGEDILLRMFSRRLMVSGLYVFTMHPMLICERVGNM